MYFNAESILNLNYLCVGEYDESFYICLSSNNLDFKRISFILKFCCIFFILQRIVLTNYIRKIYLLKIIYIVKFMY